MMFEFDLLGVPGLEQFEQYATSSGIRDDAGNPISLVGLLGRDFLQYCMFRYDGLGGSFSLELDTHKIPFIDNSVMDIPS